MARIKAPRRLLLYCRPCDDIHIFTLSDYYARYYGACYEVTMPESLLNQALGHEITIHTLLAQYSSSVEGNYEELLMPTHTLV